MDYEKDGLIPEHTIGGIKRYIERGVDPGGFLAAVFKNDLFGAVAAADSVNLHKLGDIVKWLMWYAPRGCHGSLENYREWKRHSGITMIVREEKTDD